MANRIQIHALLPHTICNLNRDDLGRPKTATVGGKKRGRISSQCNKRSYRVSDILKGKLSELLGIRTKKLGEVLFERMVEKGMAKGKAKKNAILIAKSFGSMKQEDKLDKDGKPIKKKNKKVQVDTLKNKTLVHYSPLEFSACQALADSLVEEDRSLDKDEDLSLLMEITKCMDISLFGRMLAEHPENSVDAACQVAHAFTTTAVDVEQDYLTAVEDLNKRDTRGSGHLMVQEYLGGVFYLYININCDVLLDNMGGDWEKCNNIVKALLEAIMQVSPSGKQNSYASFPWAPYAMVRKGDDPQLSLAGAFLKPVPQREGGLIESIVSLEDWADRFEDSYGGPPCEPFVFNNQKKEGPHDSENCRRYRERMRDPSGSIQDLMDYVSVFEEITE